MCAKGIAIIIVLLTVLWYIMSSENASITESKTRINIAMDSPQFLPCPDIRNGTAGGENFLSNKEVLHRITDNINDRVRFLREAIDSQREEMVLSSSDSSDSIHLNHKDIYIKGCQAKMLRTLLLMAGRVAQKVGSSSVCQMHGVGCSSEYLDLLEDEWYNFQEQFASCSREEVKDETLGDVGGGDGLDANNAVWHLRPSSGNWSQWVEQCTESVVRNQPSIGGGREEWLINMLKHPSLNDSVLHHEVSRYLHRNALKAQLDHFSDRDYRYFQEQFQKLLSHRGMIERMRERLICSFHLFLPFSPTSRTGAPAANAFVVNEKPPSFSLTGLTSFSSLGYTSSPIVAQLYVGILKKCLWMMIQSHDFFNTYIIAIALTALLIWAFYAALIRDEDEISRTSKISESATWVEEQMKCIFEEKNKSVGRITEDDPPSYIDHQNFSKRVGEKNISKLSESGNRVLNRCEQMILHIKEQILPAQIFRAAFLITFTHTAWCGYLLYHHYILFYSDFTLSLWAGMTDVQTRFPPFSMSLLSNFFKMVMAHTTFFSLVQMVTILVTFVGFSIKLLYYYCHSKGEAELIVKQKESVLDTEIQVFVDAAEIVVEACNRPKDLPIDEPLPLQQAAIESLEGSE